MPKCKKCKEKFTPKKFLQKYCMVNEECITVWWKEEKEKKWKKEKVVLKEKLLSHKDYLNILQKVFNTFIRERDKDLPCISCGCYMKERKGDASHYYSVGGNPALRFNEDNVHLSCVPCNQFKHGNLIEYGLRLPGRIGQEKFNQLSEDRNKVVQYSIHELKELITLYKSKIKQLKP